MIDIQERFAVGAPPEEVYAVLSDPSALVQCVQGAALGETHDDGSIDATMTVRFSAMRIDFKGRFTLALDAASLTGTVEAGGRDGQGGTRFRGTASFSVAPGEAASSAEVCMKGEIELTGRMASVIEGAADAVVRRMTAEFVEALSLRCASESTTLRPEQTAAAAPAALLLHGFGHAPNSLRAWGEALTAEGVAVSIPRLPGHGTRWQDLNGTTFEEWYAAAATSLSELTGSHPEVYVMGISSGALLALALAVRRPSDVAGLVLVNPLVSTVAGTPRLVGLAKHILGSTRAVAPNDVKGAERAGLSYDRVPLRAAASVREAGRRLLPQLGEVRQPVLLVTSSEDHVVRPVDAELVAAAIPEGLTRRITFGDSYHVLPLDNDAPALFRESVVFMGGA